MLFSKNDDNTTTAVIQLAKHFKLPVAAKTIAEEPESHPNHLSLLSISEVLNRLLKENVAFDNAGIKQLIDMPCHFITPKNNYTILPYPY
jgi:hypothetical protein